MAEKQIQKELIYFSLNWQVKDDCPLQEGTSE